MTSKTSRVTPTTVTYLVPSLIFRFRLSSFCSSLEVEPCRPSSFVSLLVPISRLDATMACRVWIKAVLSSPQGTLIKSN